MKKEFGFIVILIILISIMNINSFEKKEVADPKEDDRVKSMPEDYPYDVNKNKMYSGYLNVDESGSRQLHYIYLESQNDPTTTPLLIWLNGGPGCSSMLGFVDENGPTFIETSSDDKFKFILNQFSWNKLSNVLYIESPAGVGFSIATKPEDLVFSDEKVANDNLGALLTFYKRFPELKSKDLYISGESYAGVYIPFFADKILTYNLQAKEEDKIKIKGILIGNGVTDLSVDTVVSLPEYAVTHNIISDEMKSLIDKYNCSENANTNTCKTIYSDLMMKITRLNIYDIYGKCYVKNSVNYTPWSEFSKLQTTPPCVDDRAQLWYLNRKDVKKSFNIHEEMKFAMCNEYIQKNYEQGIGSFHLYKNLLKKIKIWVYSGDSDACVPTNGTRKWIKKLQIPIVKSWRSWRIRKDNIAGYVEDYDGLTFVTFKAIGHMVPQFAREESFKMLQTFLGNEFLN